jgi:hypothetical protein
MEISSSKSHSLDVGKDDLRPADCELNEPVLMINNSSLQYAHSVNPSFFGNSQANYSKVLKFIQDEAK